MKWPIGDIFKNPNSDTPMHWFLIKSVNVKYPVSCGKCVKKQNLHFQCPARPPQVCHTPPKMVPPYSLGTCWPKTPKPHWSLVAPSLRKNWFSEDKIFAKSTLLWSSQKFTYFKFFKLVIRCHKRCLKLSWVQIWQKKSNGKCLK